MKTIGMRWKFYGKHQLEMFSLLYNSNYFTKLIIFIELQGFFFLAIDMNKFISKEKILK